MGPKTLPSSLQGNRLPCVWLGIVVAIEWHPCRGFVLGRMLRVGWMSQQLFQPWTMAIPQLLHLIFTLCWACAPWLCPSPEHGRGSGHLGAPISCFAPH